MSRQAKPGETIRDNTGKEFVVIECPQRFVDGMREHKTWVKDDGGIPMYFSDPSNYVILDSEFAEPGDTIEVTHEGDQFGNQHLVIECPNESKPYDKPEWAWHENEDRGPSFCKSKYYKIIKRKKGSASARSVVTDTPVDLEKSFRQKRDELLKRAFNH